MGSSKIVFVGAVAVIIGLFGFGIKKAEKNSADVATAHAFQLQAKTLAEQGMQVGIRKLPGTASAVTSKSYQRTTKQGTFGYSFSNTGMPAGQVNLVSFGILNGQKATLVTTLAELPSGPKPAGVKSWKGWKLVSSVRTFATIEQ